MAQKVFGLNNQQLGFLILGMGGILGGLSGLTSFTELVTPGQLFPLLAQIAGLIGGVLTRPNEVKNVIDTGEGRTSGKGKGGAIGYRGPRRDEAGDGPTKS